MSRSLRPRLPRLLPSEGSPVKLIPLNQISISANRQRKEFDPEALNSLVEDIRENGLFNAIVLRTPEVKSEEFTMEVLAGTYCMQLCQGERRLRAIQDLWSLGGTLRYDGEIIPEGRIPYVTLGDLDPLRAEICELSENMVREDLTWQEQAAATARIMQLRGELAKKDGDAPPTTAAIAEEVRGSSEGVHHETTRREILLADLIKTDEDVRAAKTLDEAWKVAKKKESSRRNAELGEMVGKTFSVADHTLLNEDAIEWLRMCADSRFDVILTDPPYGMAADEFTAGGGGAHGYADDEECFLSCWHTLKMEAARITKPQAHMYIFCDINRFHYMRDGILGMKNGGGWEVHRTPLIWHKMGNSGGIPPWPDYGPRRSYELILYAVKGKRPVTGIYPDVLSYPSDPNLGHGAQKPVALYADLLRRSCVPGNSALDCFGGTGPLLPAAHGLKVAATVVEKDPGSYGIAVNRMKGLK